MSMSAHELLKILAETFSVKDCDPEENIQTRTEISQ